MNSQSLINMAKQIIANQAITDPQEAADALTLHLTKFWAPQMRKEFIEALTQDPENSSDILNRVIRDL